MTEDKPFGNLTFSTYTVETDAERCLLEIQAALRVKGYGASHPTMKKVLRLKRSMTRNKVRRYSFSLIPVQNTPATQKSAEAPAQDKSELIIPVLEQVTGLAFHSKESRLASSGHFIVKFVLVGKLDQFRVEPGVGANLSQNKAREEIASRVFQKHRSVLSSFSLQPFRIRTDPEKGRVGLSVQCIYRGSNEKEEVQTT